jgi:hypothetical protein
MVNILGYPNTSTFATFGYCAALHVDNDDSATSGWVMERDPAVRNVLFWPNLSLTHQDRFVVMNPISFGARIAF